MADVKFANKNEFKIVGTLKDCKVADRESKQNGQTYVSADTVVESIINGKVKTFEVRFFCASVTQDGKPSTLYDTYKNLPDLIGKKVELTGGSIRENMYWSTRTEQIVSSYELSGRFVRGVADSVADEATYGISGFVVAPLTEKVSKNGNVYRYDIALGQSNYAGNNMSKIVLHTAPKPEAGEDNMYYDRDLFDALNGLTVGETVELRGDLDFIQETVTQEKKSGFGKPTMQTFTNTQRNFYITSGDVLDGEGVYDSETIKDLVATYKDTQVEIQNKTKSNTKTTASVKPAAEKKITKTQSALI